MIKEIKILKKIVKYKMLLIKNNNYIKIKKKNDDWGLGPIPNHHFWKEFEKLN